MFGRKRRLEAAVTAVRVGYDRAVLDAGVILFQQTADGEDGHYVSSSVADLLGWEATAFRTPGTLRRLVHPDDLAAFRSAAPVAATDEPTIDLRSLLGDPAPVRDVAEPVVRLLTASGDYRPMLVRMARTGMSEPLRGSLIDASAGATDHQRTRRLAEVADISHHGHLLFELLDRDDPSTVVFKAANDSARRMFELDPAMIDGGRLEQIFDGSTARLLQSALFDVAHTGESLTARRLSFAEVAGTFIDLRIDRLADGCLGVTIDDVTETVDTEERLRHQALHDHLTGLANRAALDDRVALVAAGLSMREHVAVILVEIDGLDRFNREGGHHSGDQVIVELGRRLDEDVTGVDLVARIGGNEFAVLTTPSSDRDALTSCVRAVQDAMDRPIDVDGDLRAARCTIGAAYAPEHGQDPGTLLRSADGALRQARDGADALAVFDPVVARSLTRRVGILTELRRGLANNELELRYQPVVDLRTGRVTKVESILRWQHDDGRPRSVELLELAEHSGLIEPLTRWVLGESSRAAERLGRDRDALVVSTDLSLQQIRRDELMGFIELLVRSGELTPTTVEVELAEPDVSRDLERATELVAHLHAVGIHVAIDDFGAGFMSVATIGSIPVSSLKIDRGYTNAVASVSEDADAVASTIDLAHGLGLTVTAVGVNDATTLERLATMGCDHAQGVHLSEPVPFEDLPRRVDELESAMGTWVGARAVLLDQPD